MPLPLGLHESSVITLSIIIINEWLKLIDNKI